MGLASHQIQNSNNACDLQNNYVIYLTNAHLMLAFTFASTGGHNLVILFIDVYMKYITYKSHSH